MDARAASPVVIDTATNVRDRATALFARGVRAVIRYYTSSMSSGKLLRPDEARALGEAGLGIAVVYQVMQNQRIHFSQAHGTTAGRNAWRYAMETIGQPAGSAIYFAVDYDASTQDVEQAIVPYFEAARAQLRPGDLMKSYRIGVYGSGRVCGRLLDLGLVDLAWLAAPTGWAGYQAFRNSERWVLRQDLHISMEGVPVDPDYVQPGRVDFGQFTVAPSCEVPGAKAVGKHRVTSTALNVRRAPDPDAAIVGSLSNGTIVDVVGFAGEAHGWAALASSTEPGIVGYSSMNYLAAVR